jgi:phosphate transport system substrate-binding protein
MGNRLRGAVVLAVPIVFSCTAVSAEDVTLTARNGDLAVSGTLRSYDGAVYRVDTAYGLLALDAAGVTCDGPGCPDLTSFVPVLRIVGPAGSGAGLVAALVEEFATASGLQAGIEWTEPGAGFQAVLGQPGRPPALRLRFRAVLPDRALAALDAAEADFAVVIGDPGRRPARLIGRDPLLPAVAPGNRVDRISLRDLRAAAAGAIDNWQALGGPDMPLAIHALDPADPVQVAVDAVLGAPYGPTVRRHPDAAAMSAAVAADPWALAVLPASALGGAVPLLLADSCGHLIRPDRFAVKAEDYPLAADVHLVWSARRPPPFAAAFREHLATPAAQSAVAITGLADLAPEARPAVDQGGRLLNAIRAAGPEVGLAALQQLAAAMTGAERLSLTIRFSGGARQFDAASRSHIADLALLLEAGLLDGREVVFAGFSDGDGDAAANLALSRARAEAVRDAVQEASPLLRPGRVRMTVEAHGEALPIACDDTPVGRRINRRVEVWLRPLRSEAAED